MREDKRSPPKEKCIGIFGFHYIKQQAKPSIFFPGRQSITDSVLTQTKTTNQVSNYFPRRYSRRGKSFIEKPIISTILIARLYNERMQADRVYKAILQEGRFV